MRRSSSPANLEGLKYTKIEGDLSDLESLRSAVRGMDYVFHLAGTTAAPNREVYFEHNARGAERLARAVAEENPGLTRFVHVSSQAAAGPATSLTPSIETDPEQPVSLYGMSKLEGEKEVLRYKDRMPITIVRPPMVYGPKDKGVFVLIQTVSRSLMPVIQGSGKDGHKYYSAIHVQDLCRGITQAAFVPAGQSPSGDIFYLTGDGVHTYSDILSTIAECLDVRPIRFPVPRFAIKAAAAAATLAGAAVGRSFPLNMDKVNEILPDYWICSSDKAKNILKFAPGFDLHAGMTDAVEWYKRNRWL